MSTNHDFLQAILFYTAKAVIIVGNFLFYYALLIPFCAIPAVLQERKIWLKTSTPLNSIGMVKVYFLNFFWMALLVVAFILLFPLWFSRGFGGSVQKEAHCIVEKYSAMLLTRMFIGKVEIINEHLLPHITLDGTDVPAPVFIANHCSQADVCIVYYAVKRFRWIAKQSVLALPGVGVIMSLSGHILIKRSGRNRDSVNNLYEQSNLAIQSGIPMFLFPQGTRRMTERLPFKDGAFKIALENKSLIIPLSIEVPPGLWNSVYPIHTIKITVHDGVHAREGMDRTNLKKQCEEIVYCVLPESYRGSKKSD